MSAPVPLGWFGILRLGLVQTSLGAIVVMTTSTLNRVMVVELALPAILPGLLVGLHYAVQISRPRFGHGSDVSGRRTPWIILGMAVLALGGFTAALATAWMAVNPFGGIILAIFAFIAIGLGVGASGTTLLVLLAKRVDEARRPAAATTVWTMMICGFIITAGIAGTLLDPFTMTRMVMVSGGVSLIALALTVIALWNIEGDAAPVETPAEAQASFREALAEVWAEPSARRFAIFVFISMLAYSAQDLILEPFAGLVFGMTPGETTKLSGVQHAGVLAGMICVGAAGSYFSGTRFASMPGWAIGGCIASAFALAGLSCLGLFGAAWSLQANVFLLGFANGAYAVAAIASMMLLVGKGNKARAGVRMGLWGAAQAIAFGLGGIVGTLASDLARAILKSPVTAYAVVFAGEAILFLVSAALAFWVIRASGKQFQPSPDIPGEMSVQAQR